MQRGEKPGLVTVRITASQTKSRSAEKTMPKKIDAAKSRMRSKSVRKPLQEVSNGKVSIVSASNLRKAPEGNGGQTGGGDSLDRLLLVHSDISSLLREIDELVVQALQLTGDEGRKEVKKFADMLSDVQTSLKPWIPRFQKAISCKSNENKLELSTGQPVIHPSKESTDAFMESPEESKWESLISPSPLVSWRAECKTEGGRQLFLLTPLPQTNSFSSKLRASSIPKLEHMTFEETSHPVSFFDAMGNAGSDLPQSVPAKPPAKSVAVIEADKVIGTIDNICASPANASKMDGCSMFVMTPCLKMSPPKSCILLEPVSEFSKKKNPGAHKSTPFPAGIEHSDSQDSEPSASQSSDDLKVKYPELFGINMNNLRNKKATEDSPNWMVSPPKTCVVMEPPDEKSSKKLPDFREATFDLAESTPMIKEPLSNFRTGKHPGENTLKKELWTKFEAASSYSIVRLNPSILHTSSKKGFLDRLEEACDA